MGFIEKFLSLFKENKNEEEIAKAKKENLNFNPKLIPMLKKDHKKLFELYEELMEIGKNGEVKEIHDRLVDFKMALEVHLMVEDTQLYGYLKKKYADDKMVSSFILDVQKEMSTIAKNVLFFIRKYSDAREFQKYKDHFIEDLDSIGKVLSKRIEMEESRLYTLYQP